MYKKQHTPTTTTTTTTTTTQQKRQTDLITKTKQHMRCVVVAPL
jgi:hypothetical protein